MLLVVAGGCGCHGICGVGWWFLLFLFFVWESDAEQDHLRRLQLYGFYVRITFFFFLSCNGQVRRDAL